MCLCLLLQGILWHESFIQMLLRMVKFVWTLWKRIGNPPLASAMFFLYSPIPCLVSFTSLRYGKMLTIDLFMLSVISVWELSVRSTQHVFLFQYSWSFSCLELWFQCFCDHSYDAWICVVSHLFLYMFCFFGFRCQPLLWLSLPVSSRLVTETQHPG